LEICSIGSSGITARQFFELLTKVAVTCIVDTRVHASSQLAGFTRKESLEYFAGEILGIPYVHELALAPEAHSLKAYRSQELTWESYEAQYLSLLTKRDVSSSLDMSTWGVRPVFLCSERTADHCHRRLAASYLAETRLDLVTSVRHL